MITTRTKKRVSRTLRNEKSVKAVKSETPKKRTNRKSSVTSLENGIKIVSHAISKRLSLSASSNANGKGKNYISDIKARLEENYKSKNISKSLYDTFKRLNKQYQKEVK